MVEKLLSINQLEFIDLFVAYRYCSHSLVAIQIQFMHTHLLKNHFIFIVPVTLICKIGW
jgi:hypothetical protein